MKLRTARLFSLASLLSLLLLPSVVLARDADVVTFLQAMTLVLSVEGHASGQSMYDAPADRVQAYRPPPAWQGRLVFHRQQLSNLVPDDTESMVFAFPALVQVSEDGAWTLYQKKPGEVRLRNNLSGESHALLGREDTALAFSFVDAHTLLGRYRHQQDPQVIQALFDLDGRERERLPNIDNGLFDAVGEGVLAIGRPNSGDRNKCLSVILFDPHTRQTQVTRLPAPGADQCTAIRLNPQGKLEFIAQTGTQWQHYVDGQGGVVFQGDTRSQRTSWPLGTILKPELYWIGRTHWLGSRFWRHEDNELIWDVEQGKSICQIKKDHGTLQEDGRGRILLSKDPMLIDPRPCQQTALDAWGDLIGTLDGWNWGFDRQSGKLTFRDAKTDQTVLVLSTGWTQASRETAIQVQRLPHSNLLAVGRSEFESNDDGEVLVFDPRNGAVVLAREGRLSAWTPGFSVLFGRHAVLLSRLIPSTPQLALSQGQDETFSDYRARIARQQIAYGMEVEVDHYDAKGGYLAAKWKWVPIDLPMTPAQAQQVAGLKTLSIQGTLAVLDTNWLALQHARVRLPDGASLALPESP